MPQGTHQVRDGARLLTFDGELLGHITSGDKDKTRWTEMSVYKTTSGTYILEKVGKSIVTHMPECVEIRGEIPRFQTAHPGADPDDFEYHDCVPDEYDFTKLLVELDRYWATIAEDPQQIIEALYRKRDGVRHMPRISIELLEKLGNVDPAFQIWQQEFIT